MIWFDVPSLIIGVGEEKNVLQFLLTAAHDQMWSKWISIYIVCDIYSGLHKMFSVSLYISIKTAAHSWRGKTLKNLFINSLVLEGCPVRMKCALSLLLSSRSMWVTGIPGGLVILNTSDDVLVQIVEKVRALFTHTGRGPGPTLQDFSMSNLLNC